MYMVDLKNNKGFTLVDVIIAGAVIAILIVMTFPLMSDFLLLKNEKEEEATQEEILRTMHVMAEQEFRIPVTDSIVDFASETQLY
jgi:Tfp pilus assembly protein PilE